MREELGEPVRARAVEQRLGRQRQRLLVGEPDGEEARALGLRERLQERLEAVVPARAGELEALDGDVALGRLRGEVLDLVEHGRTVRQEPHAVCGRCVRARSLVRLGGVPALPLSAVSAPGLERGPEVAGMWRSIIAVAAAAIVLSATPSAAGRSGREAAARARRSRCGETGWFASPALVDLDGDRRLEIVAPSYRDIRLRRPRAAARHRLGDGGPRLRAERRGGPGRRRHEGDRGRRQRGDRRRLRARAGRAAGQAGMARVHVQRRPVPGDARPRGRRPGRRRPRRGRGHDDQHVPDRLPGVRVRRGRPRRARLAALHRRATPASTATAPTARTSASASSTTTRNSRSSRRSTTTRSRCSGTTARRCSRRRGSATGGRARGSAGGR